MTTLAADPVSHVLPHELFKVAGFSVSNQMFMGTFSAVMVILVFSLAARRIRVAGTSKEHYLTKGIFGNLMETFCVFIREEVARPNLQHLTDKYIKYLWTVFFFVLFCNLIGMIPFGPIVGIISGVVTGDGFAAYKNSYWGGTATGNLSLNIPLALCSLVAIVFIGIREAGFKHFIHHLMPGPIWMAPLMIPLEILGLLIKCTVLAMRLFGTMMAGHLVIAVFLSLIPASGALMFGVGIAVVFGGTALLLLELFIAMLQAFIFTFLTTLFIASFAVVEHEHHEEESHLEEHGMEPIAAAPQ